ncbi:unnamed protein product [Cuscuta europaea]|uniref:PDZ domain-containing protein n=1 Tax=Cuscuta europaea TaxID=41803 RepID=A0A9P0YLM7_CUSEU|nr:unnamed protein product [Cuscuta europaea]
MGNSSEKFRSSSESEKVATPGEWQRAVNKVVQAVVAIHVTAFRSFDTESAGSSIATGFVVDKRRGIILTNRHVVSPGPVVAEAMFMNNEEIPIYPIYRDPVHDFGFFRYDPGAIQFLDYEEIPLAPEAAHVGLEIRVVGNDSGEKVSIMAGTLARLDRDAPTYMNDGYNDFNTFYIQAASGTKGGSSGSPVIDSQGRAVALNAGGKTSSASAFFLPLERVVRALAFLQQGRDSTHKWEAVFIPRGTLQVTFVHKGFDETRRLGVQSETERLVRSASRSGETGMLVVDSVVPCAPAYDLLKPGDVLVCMNEKVTTHFLEMETLLDDNVGKNVELKIERGGASLTFDLVVQNLHSITPDRFLEVSGAVIHPLSYQQARNFNFQCGLVYVAESGYMLSRAGVPDHSIIKKFAGKVISNLEELIHVLSNLTRDSRVPLEYIRNTDRHRIQSVLVPVDRQEWHAPPLIYTRDDGSGLWFAKPALLPDCVFLSDVIPAKQNLLSYNVPQHVSKESSNAAIDMEPCYEITIEGPQSQDDIGSGIKKRMVEEISSVDGTDAANASVAVRVIEPTLVMCEVHVPISFLLEAVHKLQFCGTGVIVYHSQSMGLVAVDRNTVVASSCDVMLSFAAFPIEIPGEVVFLDPVHNFALVAYDPSALGPDGYSAVHAAELLPEPLLRRGDSVSLVGLSTSLQAISRKSIVTNPYAALNIESTDCPRYRAINMEVIELDTDFGTTFTGVLSDERGRVQALWGSFSYQTKYPSGSVKNDQNVRGIPIYAISRVLEKIISGANGPFRLINGVRRPLPLMRILEVELYPTLLSKARSFGLSDTWIQALVKKDCIRRRVLKVKSCFAGSSAEKLLEQGDTLLAINKEPVTCFRDIEDACQELYNGDGKLCITIFRQGCEMELLVGTDMRDGNGTTHAVNWCGCIVQYPHPAVRALGFLPNEGHGVYVTSWRSGSPANRYGLFALQWIVEINGKATPNLDAFVEVTKGLEHEEFVRVRTVRLDGKNQVLTLKQDLHYWPTLDLRFDPETAMWRRKIIKGLDFGSM